MTSTDYKNYTQHQKILTLMCKFRDKQWWFPYDFMLQEQGDLFVGYEASARLSELGSEYPAMIETQQAGKYKRRRVCFETIEQWLPDLPKDLRYVFHRTGQTKDIVKPVEPVLNPPQIDEPQTMEVTAMFRGKRLNLVTGSIHTLLLEKLKIGSPVVVLQPLALTYRDIKAFQKDWGAV